MPFDVSGNFTRLYNWQSDRDSGIKILAARMDGEFDNFAVGMNQVFFRNGLVPMSGSLNLGQNYIFGLGAGSSGVLSLRWADDATSGLFLNGVGKPTLVAGGNSRLEANSAGIKVTGTSTLNGNATITGTLTATASIISSGDVSGTSLTTAGRGDFGYITSTDYIYAAGGLSGKTPNGGGLALRIRAAADSGFGTIGFTDNIASTLYSYMLVQSSGLMTYSNIINASGLLVSGNSVWHAANFNPASYAALAGAAFTGGVSAPSLTATGNITSASITTSGNISAASIYSAGTVEGVTPSATLSTGGLRSRANSTSNIASLQFTDITAGNEFSNLQVYPNGIGYYSSGLVASNLYVGNTSSISPVWHSGNFNPANYYPLTGGTLFGSMYATGQVGAVTPNDGTTGALRLRANPTTGFNFIQFLTADGTGQSGYLYEGTDGSMSWTGAFSAVTLTATSDARLKKNLIPIADAENILKKIRGYRYNWKDNNEASAGVMAQEIEPAIPELVRTLENGTKAVNYNGLIGVLIETIRNLIDRVELLEIRNI